MCVQAKWNKHLLDKVPDFSERGSGVQHKRREASRWQHLSKTERLDEVHTTHLLDRIVRKARDSRHTPENTRRKIAISIIGACVDISYQTTKLLAS